MLIFKHRLFGINGVLWKFAREKIPDTMRKNLSGFGSFLRLTLNEIFCAFLFVSLTKSKGISGKNAITAAIRIIMLKSAAINQIKIRTKIAPRIAPAVSNVL